MNIIELNKDKVSRSHIGGGAFVRPEDFPGSSSSGEFMLHFMTLDADLLPIDTLPEGYQISIFLPANIKSTNIDLCSDALWSLRSGYQENPGEDTPGACVLLHQKTAHEYSPDMQNTLPKFYLSTRPATKKEWEQEREEDGPIYCAVGLQVSKLHGKPALLQDEYEVPPETHFCLQIFEHDLMAADASYEGVFEDGAGYLWLNNALKTQTDNSAAGTFFVQFT